VYNHSRDRGTYGNEENDNRGDNVSFSPISRIIPWMIGFVARMAGIAWRPIEVVCHGGF